MGKAANNCISAGKEFSHASNSWMTWGIRGYRSEGDGGSDGIGRPRKGVHSEAIRPRGVSEGRNNLVLSENGGWVNGGIWRGRRVVQAIKDGPGDGFIEGAAEHGEPSLHVVAPRETMRQVSPLGSC